VVLDIRDLRVVIDRPGGPIGVVDGVCLSVPRGQTVALVGESGCGKSMTALAIMRLLRPPCRVVSGQIVLTPHHTSSGLDLLQLSERAMRDIRGNRVAIIFQDAMTALNPVYTVGEQIAEAILLHQKASMREARSRAVELLRRAALPDPKRVASEHPHRLSGGMRQRALIAMALACAPDLLIADEPTTALDVTTQREILELLQSLQQADGMGILLITHDLGMVADVADGLHVMYAGRVVEHGRTAEVLARPLHPYTRGLLECTPRLGQTHRRFFTIPGTVPDPAHWPAGCRFHPRCRRSMELAQSRAADPGVTVDLGEVRVLRKCAEEEMRLREVAAGHAVACGEAETFEPGVAPWHLAIR
jgi:oligopeptide/dipeptide ABC transporter ATP-binding protein